MAEGRGRGGAPRPQSRSSIPRGGSSPDSSHDVSRCRNEPAQPITDGAGAVAQRKQRKTTQYWPAGAAAESTAEARPPGPHHPADPSRTGRRGRPARLEHRPAHHSAAALPAPPRSPRPAATILPPSAPRGGLSLKGLPDGGGLVAGLQL